MAVVTFRSATTTTANGASSISAARPAGTSSGDVLVAFVGHRNANVTVLPPSGWVEALATVGGQVAGTAAYRQHVLYKVAGGAEPSSYSFGLSSAQNVGVIVAAYSGVSTTAPINVSAGTGAQDSTSASAPSVTTSVSGTVVLGAFGIDQATAMSFPAGTTVRASMVGGASISLVDFPQSTAGATGSKSSTASDSFGGSDTVGQQVALAPGNFAPNAPTLADVGSINKDASNRLSWTPSDPDGDSQSAYDLQERVVGAPSWNTLSASTPNAFRDFPAGYFTASDREWRVRTYDSAGLVGPYSGSGFFTAGIVPDGPVITDPISGQTISTDTYLLVWSTPDQDSYQVRILDAADAVVFDSGTVTSASARSLLLSFPTTGVTRKLQVRTTKAGLTSPYTTITNPVSYTGPALSTFTLEMRRSVQLDDGTWTTVAAAPGGPSDLIAVAYSQPAPSGGQPVVSSVDVERRVAGVGDGIRIAKDQPATGTYLDRTPASGVEYEYRLTAVGANGTSSTTDWVGDAINVDPEPEPEPAGASSGYSVGGYTAGYGSS